MALHNVAVYEATKRQSQQLQKIFTLSHPIELKKVSWISQYQMPVTTAPYPPRCVVLSNRVVSAVPGKGSGQKIFENRILTDVIATPEVLCCPDRIGFVL
jgi:hypothetical protein